MMTLPPNPAPIATEIRSLAGDAHHLLNDPHATAIEIEMLLDRISGAKRQLRGHAADASLFHWLENAQRRLVARGVTSNEP
jgi:hypothetical protein